MWNFEQHPYLLGVFKICRFLLQCRNVVNPELGRSCKIAYKYVYASPYPQAFNIDQSFLCILGQGQTKPFWEKEGLMGIDRGFVFHTRSGAKIRQVCMVQKANICLFHYLLFCFLFFFWLVRFINFTLFPGLLMFHVLCLMIWADPCDLWISKH